MTSYARITPPGISAATLSAIRLPITRVVPAIVGADVTSKRGALVPSPKPASKSTVPSTPKSLQRSPVSALTAIKRPSGVLV